MRTVLMLLALLPALALAQTAPPEKKPATNQVYKWVDKDGVVHYTDKPPTESATPAKLPPLQTYKGGTNPNLGRFDEPRPGGGAATPGPSAQVQVVTPSPDETFRGGERTVPVAVLVTPPLLPGQQLVYLLDGKSSPPTTDTSFAFTEVERGTHTAAVAVLDPGGQEIGRSAPVTFHMKPPIVRR